MAVLLAARRRWSAARPLLPLLAGLVLLDAAAAPASGPEEEPSLAVVLPGFGAVQIVTRADLAASPPTASLLLEDAAGRPVYRFPGLPGVDEYAYLRTDALALEDIDADGRDDVIAIVELVTGIGPTGAEPFTLAGVYLQRDDGFERATALEQLANSPPVYGSWSDIGALSAILRQQAQLD
jgi:hypothetical protein